MVKIRFCFTVFFIVMCLLGYSQKEDIQFEHLSMKDGLSMNPIMAITQDSKGFLWFGSQDGLNRYDGYRFEVFKANDNDSASISDNFITSLCNDNSGKLWVGTLKGLNLYYPETNSFKQFITTTEYFSCLKIYCLFKDKEGLIWIGTEKGLALFDSKKEEFLAINSKLPGMASLQQKTILCINQDQSGDYWIGTTSGLMKYRLSDATLKTYSSDMPNGLSNDIVLSFHEDKKGNIWIGTLEGLNKYEPKTETFEKKYFKNQITSQAGSKRNSSVDAVYIYSIVNNYGGNTIRCILEDNDGVLWIGTDMELILYNPSKDNYINYKKDLINPNGINDHFIRSMYVDRSTNIWIGTLGNGLNKANLKAKKFRHYQKKINNQYSLSENYVRSICEDELGNIWIGTLVGGLNKYNTRTDSFYHYKKSVKEPSRGLNDDNVWSLCYDKFSKGLWIGTNNGLDFLDLKTGQFKHFEHSDIDKSSISNNTIRNVMIDRNGNMWCGTERGLNKFDRQTQTFKSYTTQNSKLSDPTVWRIVENKDGKLWIATNDGLNLLDPIKNKITCFKKNEKDDESISHNGIRSLLIDSDETLWVGTQNGLNRFDSKTQKFKRYYEKDGLPNAFIYAIIEDKNHQLWISSNKGISQFNKKNNSFKNYDIFDGLQDFEFNTNAAFYSSKGDMYFGGPNGLNIFNPTKLATNNYIAPVVFTAVKILDNEYVGKAASEIKEITLNYEQNVLYFEFSSLDYTNPSRNQYMYKMEGFKDNWVNAGNVRFINYTNLNPGEYTFKVKGSNSDGVWNPDEISIKIIITPPFWKTVWFYMLCGALTVLGIFLFIKNRTRNLLRSKVLLEEKVKQRTVQVENQKNELEQKNKDITDSINYAKRIQNAVLPDEQQFLSEFSDAFIFFKPRDIVSGDLFWIAKVNTSVDSPVYLKVVAVADCTGHGVPGAFMSLMITELLNQSVKNPDINSPSDLLEFINRKLPEVLNKNNKEKIYDGMDIAVCAIDLKSMIVYYAGANRPLWIRKKNSDVIIETKATKASIGAYTLPDQIFETNVISVEKGDKIYLFTDGITDQFGGEKSKKFSKARLNSTILESTQLTMTGQKTHIDSVISKWQSDREQVDDILVVGIEI